MAGTGDLASKGNLVRTALRTHSKNTKLAMIGQGVDRLLFGLQKIAEESTGVVPDVFQTGACMVCFHPRIRAREWDVMGLSECVSIVIAMAF